MNAVAIRTAIVVLLICVQGCSAGGGAGGNAAAGIDRSGVSVGPLTGLGSVFVNGVEWNTNGATITIDDAAGNESGLRIGDILRVRGTIDKNGAATATTITSDHAIDGPISAIDTVANHVTVLGQTLLVDADTVFDESITPATIAGLTVGQNIEAHGLRDADGIIHATRIEASTSATLDVTGTVGNLDTTARTFTINALTVDYSSAALDDFNGNLIANGNIVDVNGTSLSGNGTLTATRVQFQGATELEGAGPDEDFDIEGFISSVNGTMSFVVGGVTIGVTDSTQFEGGTVNDLAVNVRVEVEGTTSSSSNFVATKVEIKRTAALKVTANVDSAPDLQNRRLKVLGITIGTSPTTQFEDNTNAVQFFGLANLSAGDHVAVRGVVDTTAVVDMIATRIERDAPDDGVELRGPTTSINGTTLTVLGVTIITTTSTQFRGHDESVLTAAEFFTQLNVGDGIDCSGTQTGTKEITADALNFGDS